MLHLLRLFVLVAFWAVPNAGFAQNDTLRLVFAGDIMGHAPQISSALQSNGQYDYSPCFKYVKPTLEAADIAIGNLELTLPGKGPYTGYPMFRSPDALATALKGAGFDVIVTANNHSNDARGPGVTSTIETLRKEGLLQTGTFKDQRDRNTLYPLMLYKNGFKIALLNYTYDTNGVPTEAPTVVNLINYDLMAADLAEARARKPHYIIVVMHWGLEYQLNESEDQRKQARFLIEHGADMVSRGAPARRSAHPNGARRPARRFGERGVGGLFSWQFYLQSATAKHRWGHPVPSGPDQAAGFQGGARGRQRVHSCLAVHPQRRAREKHLLHPAGFIGGRWRRPAAGHAIVGTERAAQIR
jgi:Putative enzyme of poly-gamma-glutamate biosynthesis (capsule formation)